MAAALSKELTFNDEPDKHAAPGSDIGQKTIQ